MDQAQRLREKVSENIERPSSRVIAVTSGKGGVGKTSLSVNLAIELTKKGQKVVILDADFGLANVEVMFGIRPRFNLSDLINKDKKIDEIITNGPNGIGFISGGSGVSDLAQLDKNQIKLLISKLVELDNMYDVVIIDTGAGINDSVLEFVLISPEVLLVVTPEPTSITDAYSLLKVLRRKNEFNPIYKNIGIVANRVENKQHGEEIFSKINIVSTKFLNTKLDYKGCIEQDKNVSMAIIEQKPVTLAYPNSVASKDISELASNLCERDDLLEEKSNGIAKVFLDFIKFKRKK